jgi:ketosteroid isomerase-like protein
MSDRLEALDLSYRLIWREGRLDTVIATVDEDFEWIVPGLPDEPVRRGPEEVRAFFLDWMKEFDDLSVEWNLHDVDATRAIAYIRMRGVGHASGVPIDMSYVQLWTFDDAGTPTRMELYLDPAEGRRAAGLEP